MIIMIMNQVYPALKFESYYVLDCWGDVRLVPSWLDIIHQKSIFVSQNSTHLSSRLDPLGFDQNSPAKCEVPTSTENSPKLQKKVLQVSI